MRKVNYFLFACLLGFGALFVGCGGGDEGEVTIALDKTEFALGEAVGGKIISVNALKEVGLTLGGKTVTGYPLTDFSAGKPVTGTDGTYTIRIENLAPGTYSIRATDGTVEDNKPFTVKAAAVVPDFEGATGNVTVATGETVYYKQGDKVGKIVITEATTTVVRLTLDDKTDVSILDDGGSSYLKKDGTTYNMADATADQANFLLAKKKADAMLCTGNSEELGTKFPNATPVVFTKKTKTE